MLRILKTSSRCEHLCVKLTVVSWNTNNNACFTYPSVRRHQFRPSFQEVLAIPADQLVQLGPLLLRGHLLLSFLVALSLQEDPSLREVREHPAPLEDLEIPGGLEVPALGKFFHCIISYNCRS